ncbi:MAG TPA: hypothetical protein VFN97_12875, partial [Actinospica sp.]|nr:hypothetical protein [Actinospica sp.]
ANKTAVFISNGLQDSLFAPNQLTPFYDDLTTAKRLMLQPGDHATSEASGLLGATNTVWTNVHEWFDHYLTGAANGIDTRQPVQIEPVGSSAYEGYPDLSSLSTSSATFDLGGTDATPGQPMTISTQFIIAAYNVPSGDSIALVVGTKDPLFLDADQSGSTVRFAGPSAVTLPLS